MTVETLPRIGSPVVISEQAKRNVMAALDAGRLSHGRFSREFELRFAALHERRFAAFVNSGTDALRIGLAAMKERYGWADGASVLVPALTFVASFNVVLQTGLRPVLVDIDRYYGMDPEQAGAILARAHAGEGEMPVAMMPVHLFGQNANAGLLILANAFGLRVIADSCETMFVPGCAMGDVSCFSTYACHLINTGVGGIVTTNDPKMAALIRSLANHGRDGIYTGIDDELGQIEVINARFRFERPGYSARATEMEAAIGCAELDVWTENLSRRRYNAARLLAELADLPLFLPETRAGSEHAWMMFPVRARTHEVRDRLVQHLESRGIETRYSLPLTDQPYIKAMFGDDVEARFPRARDVNRTGFYVFMSQHHSDADLDRIVDAFRSFFR